MKVWIQEWEESERGWGTRPDGFTVHRQKEDIDKFVEAMRKDEMRGRPKGYIPDEYSRPCGEPFKMEITDRKLMPKPKSKGQWLPPGWKPPKNVDKTREGGWKRLG